VGLGADCVSDGGGVLIGAGSAMDGAAESFSTLVDGDFGCHFFRSTDGAARAGTGVVEGWASTMGVGAMGAAGI
jgi:hypothetical protein